MIKVTLVILMMKFCDPVARNRWFIFHFGISKTEHILCSYSIYTSHVVVFHR